ncbi:MAG: class I SAM-dependent methyltransferase [Acidimicrobiia bacterium]|nr:class I SAM-dependent methyltransferase [Acidimicrobiia bacterium]
MDCRHCKSPLELVLVDLDESPPSNSYLTDPDGPESSYPLRVLVCDNCWLVQTEDFAQADEFFATDYAYFSSFSSSWLAHAKAYVDHVADRFGLDETNFVVEIAANDGYLLQYVQEKGIPCLGVEPTASTAEAARAKGIEIVGEFFGAAVGQRLAAGGRQADLTAANNVLAHVPDINDFVGGFTALLKPNGVATFEFQHLVPLVEECLFDTVYHEHYSYLSLTSVTRVLHENGLEVFDVEELPTHGGSLRVYSQRSDADRPRPRADAVDELLAREEAAGVKTVGFYQGFQPRVDAIRDGLIDFLAKSAADGTSVAAYGAAAKGNTLLNYCRVDAGQIDFVVDANPHKQNQYLPGSHIPIVDEQRLKDAKPDYVLILPWNLMPEISQQLSYVSDWGGRLLRAVPAIEFVESLR